MSLIFDVISILCLVLHLTLAVRNVELKEFESDKNVLNRDPEWAQYNAFREEMSTRNLVVYNITQLTCFDLITDYGNLKPDFTWELSNIKDKILYNTFTLKSEEFSWIEYPEIRTRAKMEGKSDDYVYMSLELEDEKAFNFTLRPQVYYLLRGQDEHGLPTHRCDSAIYTFHSTFNRSSMYERQLAQKYVFASSNYKVNRSVVIEVYVEPSQLVHQVYSADGTLRRTIDHYSLRKRSSLRFLVPFHESTYFYTGPHGYRVRVNMWLDGFGRFKSHGLSAQVGFVDGELDHDLPMSFPHRTTVTLYSQSNANVILSKQVAMGMDKVDNYFIDVCSNQELGAFIENDSLYYSVSIEAIY